MRDEKTGFGIPTKILNFYEQNIGKSIDLIFPHTTISGDLISYNESRFEAALKNHIKMKYFDGGLAHYIEEPSETIIKLEGVVQKSISSKEEREYRIRKYNLDLLKEQEKEIIKQNN